LNKLNYLSKFIGNDVENVVDIVLKLERAGHDEIRLIITAIRKALQQAVMTAHT
jgi:hypothetical protein